MLKTATREYFEPLVWCWDHWRFRELRGYPRQCYYGARQILAWIPVLWKDRDWDHGFLIDMLIFKLDRMQKAIKDGHHLNCERTARDIRITIEHLKRTRDQREYGPPMPEHDLELEDVPGSPYRRLKELQQPLKRQVRAWSKRKEWSEKQHWDSAWEMIRKHGRGWWD